MIHEKKLSHEEQEYFKALVKADVEKRDQETATLRLMGLFVVLIYIVRGGLVTIFPDVYESAHSGPGPFADSPSLVIARLMILALLTALYFYYLDRPSAKYVSITVISVAAVLIWVDAEWIVLNLNESRSAVFYLALAMRVFCLALLIYMHVKIMRRDPPIFH